MTWVQLKKFLSLSSQKNIFDFKGELVLLRSVRFPLWSKRKIFQSITCPSCCAEFECLACRPENINKVHGVNPRRMYSDKPFYFYDTIDQDNIKKLRPLKKQDMLLYMLDDLWKSKTFMDLLTGKNI
jgi:hypothetical protein